MRPLSTKLSVRDGLKRYADNRCLVQTTPKLVKLTQNVRHSYHNYLAEERERNLEKEQQAKLQEEEIRKRMKAMRKGSAELQFNLLKVRKHKV